MHVRTVLDRAREIRRSIKAAMKPKASGNLAGEPETTKI